MQPTARAFPATPQHRPEGPGPCGPGNTCDCDLVAAPPPTGFAAYGVLLLAVGILLLGVGLRMLTSRPRPEPKPRKKRKENR